MKKLIAITIMGLVALSQSQASQMSLNSGGSGVSFVLDGTTDLLMTSDGWLVSFWWKQNAGDEFKAVGLSGFLDAGNPAWYDASDYGTFMFQSSPTHPFTGDPNSPCHLSIRIFQVDAAALAELSFDNNARALVTANVNNPLDANMQKIEELWNTFGLDDNRWDGSGTAVGGGNVSGVNLNTWFGIAPGQVGVVVPEPSTWLLLGAGAAFTVVMRRRKK